MHPVLFHFGRVVVPSFALLLLAGLLAALWLAERVARLAGVAGAAAWDAGLFLIGAVFVVSRGLLVLGNVRAFLAAPVLLMMQPSFTALGLVIAFVLTAVAVRWRGLPVRRMGDAWAAPAMVAWAGLALGELAAGLDPGMPTVRWGLRTSLAGYREVPVALWAAGSAVVLAGVLVWRLRRPHRAGEIAAMALVSGGVAEFCLGFGRLPYIYPPGSVWGALDPQQWWAAGVAGVGCVLLMRPGDGAQVLPAGEGLEH